MVKGSNTEKLMSALITKMESMYSSLNDLRNENMELKKMMNNPAALLKKAGFVSTTTTLPEDISPDPFRNDLGLGDATLLKNDNPGDLSEFTNEQVHEMSWADIHEMAEQVQDVEVTP